MRCFNAFNMKKLIHYLQSPLWTIFYDLILFSLSYMYEYGNE
jgi:hypothetical protein